MAKIIEITKPFTHPFIKESFSCCFEYKQSPITNPINPKNNPNAKPTPALF